MYEIIHKRHNRVVIQLKNKFYVFKEDCFREARKRYEDRSFIKETKIVRINKYLCIFKRKEWEEGKIAGNNLKEYIESIREGYKMDIHESFDLFKKTQKLRTERAIREANIIGREREQERINCERRIS